MTANNNQVDVTDGGASPLNGPVIQHGGGGVQVLEQEGNTVFHTHNEDELKQLYKLVLKFYRDNEGKSTHLPYNDKLRLVALSQQVLHGKYDVDKLPPLGTLDVIGKDRRNAWHTLGDMSKIEGMRKFIDEASKLMPHLKPYLVAHKKVEQSRLEENKRKEDEAATTSATAQEVQSAAANAASLEAARLAAESERQLQEDQRRQIQDALNKQTFGQFKAYAEQQFPNNPDQQAILIRQLQEQHYYQYMQQIYQQQMETHAKETLMSHGAAEDRLSDGFDKLKLDETAAENFDHEEDEDDDEGEDEGGSDDGDDQEDYNEEDIEDGIGQASMWTKKEISEFKTSIRQDGGDSIIKVGHGETVTVRVPTHPEGSAIFWEFSTDSYDVAFGLFFEWNKSDDETEVSVHVSDSEDEDLDEEYEENSGDPESGGNVAVSLMSKGPPTSVIIPIYRRDCHQEVYAGTHQYPGQGVYLLKFDNTYSLWRSKTLYYRVYYTK